MLHDLLTLKHYFIQLFFLICFAIQQNVPKYNKIIIIVNKKKKSNFKVSPTKNDMGSGMVFFGGGNREIYFRCMKKHL